MSLRVRQFHDPYLVGNGHWCSCCFPDGPPAGDDWRLRVRPGCNECAGDGRVPLSADAIVAAALVQKQAARCAA